MVEIWAIPIWNGHCAGSHCSVQPENSVPHVQGSLNLTFAHTGKFGQILCYTCDVVHMHCKPDGSVDNQVTLVLPPYVDFALLPWISLHA